MLFNVDNRRFPHNMNACSNPQLMPAKVQESMRESSRDLKKDNEVRECYTLQESGHRCKQRTNVNKSKQIHALNQILKFSKIDEAETEELEIVACELAKALKDIREKENNDENIFRSSQVNKVSDVGRNNCICDKSSNESHISVDSSFLSKMRLVMGDNFMTDWGFIFDDDVAHEEKYTVVVKKEMITKALDCLMTERIDFLTELNTLYELAEYSLFQK